MTKDQGILRELAKAYGEIAANPVNGERVERIKRINGLVADRPVVWIDEIPWHEMDIEGQLTLHCEDPFARNIEWHLRSTLFRWRYFQGDMVVELAYYVQKVCHVSGPGVSVSESTVATDKRNNIISHQYEDVLATEDQLDQLQPPTVTADPEEDERNLAKARELLGDTLPVRLRGHGIYHAPWDVIARLRGVENILVDLLERPRFMHRTIQVFTDHSIMKYEAMEKLGLMDFNTASLHCTPPYTSELPAPGYDGLHVRLEDIWCRAMAQLFSATSPALQDEFDIQYMRRLMERCGLGYYGCCEPLHKVIPYLRGIKNMRKIGVSPWADIEESARQIGGDYVFARKPNPALVAGTFNQEAVAKETLSTLEACRKYGCPCELVLKDISTVSYRPSNLILWHDTVMDTIDRFTQKYGW